MKVVMTCGGTGGHIYPAIAIAGKIKKENPDAEILFIGTKKGMENRLVPAAGYEIKGIDASGIDRHNLLNNFKTAKNLVAGAHETAEILSEFKPDMVIGTGGYVTGTVVRTAAKRGIKCYIHEQNAFAGVANKMLERYVEKVFISFKDAAKYFKQPEKIVLSGNPIRSEFLTEDLSSCREKQGLTDKNFNLLVFGGSLGAEVINESTLNLIENVKDPEFRLTFVTGKRYYEEIKQRLSEMDCPRDFVKLMDYADNMPELIGACDMVVSRAGAIAVSEIVAMKKPAIFIPSPNVTGNHQYYNAKAVADAGAAVLLEEKDLLENPKLFSETVFDLAGDFYTRNNMSFAAATVAKTDAVDIIYDNIK